MRHLVNIGLIALAITAATASLSHRVRSQPAPEEWTIEIDVQLDGGDVTPLYRQQHFGSESECAAYVASDEFKTELANLSMHIREIVGSQSVIGMSKFDCIQVPSEGDPA